MTTLSLYSAADALAPLLDQIDEDGVMSDELGQALTQFEGKGVAVTAYILNCQATADMIRAAASAMAKRAVRFERRAERLRDYLANNMKRAGITSITAIDGSFEARLYIERDASVSIEDETLIPPDYLREIPAHNLPDKKLIAKAIKDGFDVPGACIVKNDRLVIS